MWNRVFDDLLDEAKRFRAASLGFSAVALVYAWSGQEFRRFEKSYFERLLTAGSRLVDSKGRKRRADRVFVRVGHAYFRVR